MKKIIFLTSIFAILSVLTLKAQVTIGTLESPVPGAILQLKSVGDAESNGDVNATKGLALPRVALIKHDQLQPMYSADEAAALSTEVKLAHKGLVVYNLTDDPEEPLSIGLNYWDGEQWNSIEPKVAQAQYSIADCDLIKANGDYFAGTPLDASNYLSVPVNVTKAGYYSMTAVPNPENGYYFSISGQYLARGPVIVRLPGAGQPVHDTPCDPIVVVLNGDTASCTPCVEVKKVPVDATIQPLFDMDCSSTKVFGAYKKGVEVTTANYITLRINVQNGAQGATWSAQTDKIDDLQFSGTGNIVAAGQQTITLYAQGTPTSTAPKNFTITTNSQSSTATCNVTVTPVIAAMKIVEFADDKGTRYGLASGNATYGGGAKQLLNDKMNFGDDPNSIFKYEGFSTINYYGPLPTSTDLNNNFCTGTNTYDIIIIDYDQTPDANQRKVLSDFVNNGGVLIYMDQNTSSNNGAMISAIFDGEAVATPISVGTGCNNVIKMNSGIDDPITNGPFGDVRTRQWGEDFSNTAALTSIPSNAIIYSGVINAATGLAGVGNGKVTMLRHPTKNFFWCGDSGLVDSPSTSGENTDNTTRPFKLASKVINGVTYPYFPADKQNYGSNSKKLPVCNSTIFANVMAWALQMAENHRINSGK